ncbi:MAG: hypothetical protein O3A29_05445 [Planctomycetota bacterium]|nr:hypothetical protein [Planctomycetota bacterium]
MLSFSHSTLIKSACFAGICLASLVLAATADAEDLKYKVRVTNLENPSGVGVHAGTGDVFVASRYGVYRYNPAAKKVHLEIAGYPEPIDVYGKGPMYNIGPLGIGFMGAEHLVVGDGSRIDGEELVRIYKINPEYSDDAEPIKEDAAEFTLGPIVAGEASAKGEGNFYGVASTDAAIYITCNGDDTKGWVAKFDIAEGKPGELTPFIATKVATEVDAPIAITMNPDGSQIVVGQGGEVNMAGDSLLTMYNPADGTLTKKLATGLNDICGLAYSPKTGKLYAVDFAWVDPTQGGLFELVIDGETVTANKLLGLDKPTALAFDANGKLYLTIFGTQEEGSEKSPGQLIAIDPGL